MNMLLLLAVLTVGCVKHHAIMGQVVDRNGKPIGRTNVTLVPGNVELITDDDGRFTIDYLRDAEGTRTRLTRRSEYAVEYFKVGYHVEKSTFYFKNGELVLDPVTLSEDTVRVAATPTQFDPEKFGDRGQEAGGSYEGE